MSQVAEPANIVLITPSDSVDLTNPIRKIRWDGAGTLTVNTVGGQSNITITGLLLGNSMDLQISRVWATGTTVTNISGYY